MNKLILKSCLASLLCIFIAMIARSCETAIVGEKDVNNRRSTAQLMVMDEIHRKNLREIQGWIISTGIGEYYKNRDIEQVEQYVKSRGYRFSVRPGIDEYHTHNGKKNHTLARIVIESENMFDELWCFEQVEYQEKIYEYWVLREASQGRSYVYRNCEFLVTEAEGLQQHRSVIFSSDQFFSKYRIAPDFYIRFPEDKIHKLYVPSYPECFQDTDLEEIKEILSKINHK